MPLQAVTTSLQRFPYAKLVADSFKRDQRISQPRRTLRRQHLILLAIGTSIKTSLFVSSGKALAAGGPATLLITGFFMGAMIYASLNALCEMTIIGPAPGSFMAYSTRFLDPAWGFALGWNYTLNSLIAVPLEIIATSLTIKIWVESSNDSIIIGACLIILLLLIFLNTKGYVNTISGLAIVKGLAAVVFCLVGFVLTLGGGPNRQYIGGRYWSMPGPFNNGFLGFSSVLVYTVFPLSGLEILGLAASETINPAKEFPISVRITFWILLPLYITTILTIGFLVPFTDIRLIDNPTNYGVGASPFIIAINDAAIIGFKTLFNLIIMITTFSTGISSIYGSSRMLVALAKQHHAPNILTYVDQKGRPIVALAVGLSTGLLAFIGTSPQADMVFSWILSFSGISSVFVWASICLAHIRFRQGWENQGYQVTQLPFRSPLGKAGSWYGLLFNLAVLLSQMWACAGPNDYTDSASIQLVGSFLAAYVYALVILFFYAGYKLWSRSSFVRRSSMRLRELVDSDAGDAQGTAG